ncbi:hypothetical protein FJZ28_04035 [Candidatus Peregrinibacteria bacterium]|nr:hypothetical protein [Candidatus Peregrinibacteria bacterium]
MQTPIPPEDPVLQWYAPQHLHQERGLLWYIGACVVVLGSLLYSILSGGWTFTVLIVAITGIYWKTHTHAPADKRMRIWKRGYAIGDTFTEWNECRGYWILRGKNFARLTIERKKGGNPVSILTGPISAFSLHEILAEFIEELPDGRESVVDMFIRILKI